MAFNMHSDIDVPRLQQFHRWNSSRVSQRQDSLTRPDPTESLIYDTQMPDDWPKFSDIEIGMRKLRNESKGKEKVTEPPGESSTPQGYNAKQIDARWQSTLQGAILDPPKIRCGIGDNPTVSAFSRPHHITTEVDLCQDGAGRELNFIDLMDRENHSKQKRFEQARMIEEQQFFGFLDTTNATPQRSDCQTAEDNELRQKAEWESAKEKAKIVAHPLYGDLMAAHVACLRVGTPVALIPYLDKQLAQAQEATNKYCVLYPDELDISLKEKAELDRFMVHDITLLTAYKDQLQQRINRAVSEAMMFCWNTEQELYTMAGAAPVYGTGATRSDEGEGFKCVCCADDPNLDYTGGFGPLQPTETDRTNLERVRPELKLELKEAYRQNIFAIREEILRTGRVVPEASTKVLKAWWRAHIEWPYPTEDDKERFSRQTGLPLKFVNNWFINQRKRNWHGHHFPATSSELKKKRKLSCESHVESGLGPAGARNLQPMATTDLPSSNYNLRPEEQWSQDEHRTSVD